MTVTAACSTVEHVEWRKVQAQRPCGEALAVASLLCIHWPLRNVTALADVHHGMHVGGDCGVGPLHGNADVVAAAGIPVPLRPCHVGVAHVALATHPSAAAAPDVGRRARGRPADLLERERAILDEALRVRRVIRTPTIGVRATDDLVALIKARGQRADLLVLAALLGVEVDGVARAASGRAADVAVQHAAAAPRRLRPDGRRDPRVRAVARPARRLALRRGAAVAVGGGADAARPAPRVRSDVDRRVVARRDLVPFRQRQPRVLRGGGMLADGEVGGAR